MSARLKENDKDQRMTTPISSPQRPRRLQYRNGRKKRTWRTRAMQHKIALRVSIGASPQPSNRDPAGRVGQWAGIRADASVALARVQRCGGCIAFPWVQPQWHVMQLKRAYRCGGSTGYLWTVWPLTPVSRLTQVAVKTIGHLSGALMLTDTSPFTLKSCDVS